MLTDFSDLTASLRKTRISVRCGYVTKVSTGFIEAEGLSRHARMGDLVSIDTDGPQLTEGEVIALSENRVVIMTHGQDLAAAIGDLVLLNQKRPICPTIEWTGRILDAFGNPLDGKPLRQGTDQAELRRAPPEAGLRKGLGARVSTGLAAMDTLLPLARGQRIGVFAGSGVGKTSLLGALAKGVSTDCVVIGLIGERGRELREFVDNVMGPEGMKRSVVVTATSDQSPLLKRRAAWTATAIAEVLRDQGKHVLLIIDSLTRFAEAHREIALTAGETPSLRAYPPSTANMIAALTERAGTGLPGSGDITAVYSVLVAGSDMEEPVADITRGVLDGHIILDREIAERGRFPAIDVRRSVSRSLPSIASEDENALLGIARRHIACYENSEALIQTGLYVPGSDPEIDAAIKIWPRLDALISQTKMDRVEDSYRALAESLGQPAPEYEEEPKDRDETDPNALP